MMIFIQLAVCATVILVAGYNLSYYGDLIAEKLGLSRSWIGVVLLASTTSLPELVTGFSSVSLAGVPDIAAGDALGSCMFNVLIVAMLDMMSPDTPISARAHQGQVLSAGFGIFMIGVAVLSLELGTRMPAVGWIGVNSLVLIVLYLAGMRMVFRYEKKRVSEFVEAVEDSQRIQISVGRAAGMYAANALFIVAAAIYLPYIGEEVARFLGIGQSFIGNVLIAASTSLPEIAVSISALKIGAVGMAFGNVFGSNLFNMAILGLDDLFYVEGVLLADVSPSHTVAGVTGMGMLAIAIVGLTYRATRKRLRLAWDSWCIIGIYLFGLSVLYFASV